MSPLRAIHNVTLVPRNVVLVLLHAYRAVISPLYGEVCKYYPSCSAYGVGAVQRYGVLRGGVLTAWRIMRCNPWARGGFDYVPASRRHYPLTLTRHGFVVSALQSKG